LSNLENIDWVQIAIFAVPVIIAITLHEAAHGFVSLRCGDDTALRAGRVTLNPLKHIDPLGTIILPILLYVTAGFIFGYAKPVPVNFAALRRPKLDMILVAGAGPGMNVLLAVISGFVGLVAAAASEGLPPWLGQAIVISILMNFALAIFNMLPIPPLDGSKVLAGMLPDALAIPYLKLGAFGFIFLLAIILLAPIVISKLGYNFDIFGTLVWQPAAYLTQELMQEFGLRAPVE
jgi:Zn-dependent protease